MRKAILFVALIASVVLFAVPAFAADATPAAATPQVAMASSIDQPVQLTADEMDSTTGSWFPWSMRLPTYLYYLIDLRGKPLNKA